MKILFGHNFYRSAGGEDEIFREEAALLRQAGHVVVEYTRTNTEIQTDGVLDRFRLASDTVWARSETEHLAAELSRSFPDVAHFHNTFPLISPAAYHVCRKAGVPVVQTLQNYRLLCPSANLFREGRVCEKCIDGSLLNSLRHRCYRGSLGATAAVATMLTVHRALGTWQDMVDLYIAPSEFVRRKFIDAGLPADRIVVKPNSINPDPGVRHEPGDRAVYVGRFWPEKGTGTMIAAWKKLNGLPLDIVGDGPERPDLEAAAAGCPNLRFLGRLPREETLAAIKRARFLVFPSEWYEGLPMTIVEAFACGVPVIASRLGTMEEVIEHGRTGLHFEAGNPDDLAAKVEWATANPEAMAKMGRAARAEFEAKYTAERNCARLMEIYTLATRRKSATAEGAPLTPPHLSMQ